MIQNLLSPLEGFSCGASERSAALPRVLCAWVREVDERPCAEEQVCSATFGMLYVMFFDRSLEPNW